MDKKPILIVEDDQMQCQMLSTLLRRKLNAESFIAHNGQEALQILEKDTGAHIKIVILDLDMPVMGGMETLEIIRQKYPQIAVIMLTGSSDLDHAVEAMRLGAVDYVSKPYQGDRVIITVKNALKMAMLSREVKRLSTVQEGRFNFGDLIGHERGLLPVVTVARKIADNDIPVLITGETGTGKEVLATAIHGESLRAGSAFVAINCGAIPEKLVESTLFGHEKGSFTGASEKAIGKFREADGGTIFLDEVGELPLDAQVKLLRVLQQDEVEPVGASKAVPVNVRVISATNRDLEEEVRAGRFREDLYFRLNVVQLHMPPLRERSQDIISLAEHFVERYAAAHNLNIKRLSGDLKNMLMAYDWPGNVRQLENMMNRAMVMSEDEVLGTADFSQMKNGPVKGSTPSVSHNDAEHHAHGDHAHMLCLCETGEILRTMNMVEAMTIKHALDFFGGNITQAADALGIAKSTFYKKLKTYDLERS